MPNTLGRAPKRGGLLRLIRLVALVLVLFGLAACQNPLTLGLMGEPPTTVPADFDTSVVPAAIRADVARVLPDYRIVEAGVGDEDVSLTLRHRDRVFYFSDQYDRVSKPGVTPVRWKRTAGEAWDLDFAQADNPRVSGFVDFFEDRYPDGEFIFDGVLESSVTSGVETCEVNIFPMRSESDGFGCYSAFAENETYRYHRATRTWTAR